ncbi:MAG TPA: nuclear transport factor 2 family protein [Longimicrobiaceae bacterium]
MRTRLLLAGLVLLAAAPARAQTAADSAAIRRTALDYLEGWYAADAGRMARAVHPELVKRIVWTAPGDSLGQIETMGATELLSQTRRGGGKEHPPERQRKEVRILDVFGDAASVRVDAATWIDYMQMAKVDGRWQIVNVLWAERPESQPR